MRYHVRHHTVYDYDQAVSLSHHVVRLAPRAMARQRCLEWRLDSIPAAATHSAHTDHFGNTADFLTIEGAHRRLEITTRSQVEIRPPVVPQQTPPWESIRGLCAGDAAPAALDVVEFVFSSPLIPLRRELAAYARASFPADRPVLHAARDLCARIHADFAFDSQATTVATPVADFFKARRGVCQDFAQLMIACVRSLGLPARYVSGYLETAPPPGFARLVGADASHAWMSLWCGDSGWVDVDPTNDLLPSDRHVTVAWGRDFADVSPLRGVLVGSGSHQMRVAVDVVPAGDSSEG